MDLDPGESSNKRLARWERIGFDQAIVRAGPLEGGHAEAVARIEFLAEGSNSDA
jgi:hypothetical protein